MSNFFYKLMTRFSENGTIKTLYKCIDFFKAHYNKWKFRNFILSSKNLEKTFTKIYTSNFWENEESSSGSGSSLEYTMNLRKHLPVVFEKFAIRSIFDGPCGDFNWMNHLLNNNKDICYIGGDIVKPLIAKLNERYKKQNIKFIDIDLTNDPFPDTDLMICRDCLFHLSYSDTRKLLNNFIKSNIKYLLTTTHINNNNEFQNMDIITGDFRLIDLFKSPYNFPNEVQFSIEDWKYPDPRRVMCLWTRDQILKALSA